MRHICSMVFAATCATIFVGRAEAQYSRSVVIPYQATAAPLNPQPLPPVDAFRGNGINRLNPQPLPPGPDKFRNNSLNRLNPQPLPPGPDNYRNSGLNRLNPQPLPPIDSFRRPVLQRQQTY